MTFNLNTIYNEDCLGNKEFGTGMYRIPDKSVDCIICDLPYGTTALKWDSVLPLDKLWEQYERIIKDNGAIVLFGSQPFTSNLIMSNPKMFKYCWVWDKGSAANFVLAKKQPLKYHEDVCVFYKKQCTYNPIKWKGKQNHSTGKNNKQSNTRFLTAPVKRIEGDMSGMKYPKSILEFPKHSSQCKLHPTMKPVSLYEYLIKTYTNEGDLVLDNCSGSGTLAIACLNTNRNYIGFELEEEYYIKANERIELHKKELNNKSK